MQARTLLFALQSQRPITHAQGMCSEANNILYIIVLIFLIIILIGINGSISIESVPIYVIDLL